MATEEDTRPVKTAAIILAAGSSSRLGHSKQLLKIGNESLLQKTIRTVSDSGIDNIIVVLGADFQVHRQEITNMPLEIVFNPDWRKGMGSSLKCGVRHALKKFSDMSSLLLMVCDQPLLSSRHIKKLISTFNSKHSAIISSFYSSAPGVPVLFQQSMFAKLLEVGDEQGAKKVVVDNAGLTTYIEFPEGSVDIDTPEDWQRFNLKISTGGADFEQNFREGLDKNPL
jgi:molybdenum cofactor cytidylyltransferase